VAPSRFTGGVLFTGGVPGQLVPPGGGQGLHFFANIIQQGLPDGPRGRARAHDKTEATGHQQGSSAPTGALAQKPTRHRAGFEIIGRGAATEQTTEKHVSAASKGVGRGNEPAEPTTAAVVIGSARDIMKQKGGPCAGATEWTLRVQTRTGGPDGIGNRRAAPRGVCTAQGAAAQRTAPEPLPGHARRSWRRIAGPFRGSPGINSFFYRRRTVAQLQSRGRPRGKGARRAISLGRAGAGRSSGPPPRCRSTMAGCCKCYVQTTSKQVRPAPSGAGQAGRGSSGGAQPRTLGARVYVRSGQRARATMIFGSKRPLHSRADQLSGPEGQGLERLQTAFPRRQKVASARGGAARRSLRRGGSRGWRAVRGPGPPKPARWGATRSQGPGQAFSEKGTPGAGLRPSPRDLAIRSWCY